MLQSHLRQKEPTGDGSSSGHGYIGGEHVDRGDSENIREAAPGCSMETPQCYSIFDLVI